jgi:hypothetical protein
VHDAIFANGTAAFRLQWDESGGSTIMQINFLEEGFKPHIEGQLASCDYI